MKKILSLRSLFNGESARKKISKGARRGALIAALLLAPPVLVADITAPEAAQTTTCDTAPAVAPAPRLPFAEELFRENLPSPLPPSVLALSETERFKYYMREVCFTAEGAAADKKPGDHFLVTALDRLGQAPSLGRPLIDAARQQHIQFCAFGRLPAGTAAEYEPAHKFVADKSNGSGQGQVLDLAHELLHAAQDRNGLLSHSFSWDIESRVRRNLSTEAAPVALEMAVAYEKKLEGDDSYWKFLRASGAHTVYKSAENQQLFEDTYQKSVAAGLPQAAALRAGAHVIFAKVFESDDWRKFYLNVELNNYINEIADSRFTLTLAVSHDAFPQGLLDKAGQIGDQPSFTAGSSVPPLAALLKGDQKMTWAYEAAEIARYRQMPASGGEAQKLEAAAVQGGNPYVGMDFAAVAKRAREASWKGQYQYTYAVMDQMLLEKAHPAPPQGCSAPAVTKTAAPGA